MVIQLAQNDPVKNAILKSININCIILFIGSIMHLAMLVYFGVEYNIFLFTSVMAKTFAALIVLFLFADVLLPYAFLNLSKLKVMINKKGNKIWLLFCNNG